MTKMQTALNKGSGTVSVLSSFWELLHILWRELRGSVTLAGGYPT